MPDVTLLTGGTLQSQAELQQGHVYLVKSGNAPQLAAVRVVRVSSHAESGSWGRCFPARLIHAVAAAAGGGESRTLLGDMRTQSSSPIRF